TDPLGSPFVYPPGEFLYYLLPYRGFGEIGRVETWAGILTIAALVVAGVRVGAGRAALVAMLYAVWGIAAFRTTDGGNDVSAGLLVVVGFVALAFTSLPAPRGRIAFAVSAVAFGWALAFKQFAVLVWPFALRHLAVAGAPWRRYLLVSGGVAAAMTLPFVLWSPGAFLSQQWQALTFHDQVWGLNLLNTLLRFGTVDGLLAAFFALEIVATTALVVVGLRARLTTIGSAALLGAAVLVVPLLLAKWTTQSYFVYAATVAAAGVVLIDAPAEVTADA
ncbi:MAG TPA: hypothetical protein VGA16_10020, partial [Candidatus Limnocylindria bacterium]